MRSGSSSRKPEVPGPVGLAVVRLNGNKELPGAVVVPGGIPIQFVESCLPGEVRCWWAQLDPKKFSERGELAIQPRGSNVICHEAAVTIHVGDNDWRAGFRLTPVDPQVASACGLQFVE